METGSNPPGQPQSPGQQPQSPGEQPQAPAPPPPAQPPAAYAPTDPGNTPAIVSLILGAVGLFFGLWFLGPFAWWQGNVGKQRVDDGVTTQNRGLAVAGQILGIIATVLLALAILTIVIVIIVAVATES
jgi:hypothetical protein